MYSKIIEKYHPTSLLSIVSRTKKKIVKHSLIWIQGNSSSSIQNQFSISGSCTRNNKESGKKKKILVLTTSINTWA